MREKDQTLEGYGIDAAIVLMIVYVHNFLNCQLLAVLAEAVKADLGSAMLNWASCSAQPSLSLYAVLGIPLAGWADVGSRKRLIAASVAFRRFSRWCHAGVWERVFAALTADRDNQYLMIDTVIVRALQQAATGKGGRRIRRWGVPEVD